MFGDTSNVESHAGVGAFPISGRLACFLWAGLFALLIDAGQHSGGGVCSCI